MDVCVCVRVYIYIYICVCDTCYYSISSFRTGMYYSVCPETGYISQLDLWLSHLLAQSEFVLLSVLRADDVKYIFMLKII